MITIFSGFFLSALNIETGNLKSKEWVREIVSLCKKPAESNNTFFIPKSFIKINALM